MAPRFQFGRSSVLNSRDLQCLNSKQIKDNVLYCIHQREHQSEAWNTDDYQRSTTLYMSVIDTSAGAS